jgi:hypothetical protein
MSEHASPEAARHIAATYCWEAVLLGCPCEECHSAREFVKESGNYAERIRPAVPTRVIQEIEKEVLARRAGWDIRQIPGTNEVALRKRGRAWVVVTLPAVETP